MNHFLLRFIFSKLHFFIKWIFGITIEQVGILLIIKIEIMKSKIHEYLKNNKKYISKKITLLTALIGMISISSCTVNEIRDTSVDNDTISEVWEYNTNINFTSSNNFSLLIPFNHTIYPSDMILVYRLSGIDNGLDVWKLLPENYFFNDGTLNFGYYFDFTKSNVFVRMIGNDLSTVPTQNRLNQVLRVVVIPGYRANKKAIDFNDYNAVVKAFNIKDNQIKIIQ